MTRLRLPSPLLTTTMRCCQVCSTTSIPRTCSAHLRRPKATKTWPLRCTHKLVVNFIPQCIFIISSLLTLPPSSSDSSLARRCRTRTSSPCRIAPASAPLTATLCIWPCSAPSHNSNSPIQRPQRPPSSSSTSSQPAACSPLRPQRSSRHVASSRSVCTPTPRHAQLCAAGANRTSSPNGVPEAARGGDAIAKNSRVCAALRLCSYYS